MVNFCGLLRKHELYNKVRENSDFFFFATNDEFSKSISWMKCPDWISWSKYFWLENDFEKVGTWINASFLYTIK